MKRDFAIAYLLLLAFAGTVLAQEQPKMPKAGPEQERLKYFVGKWNFEFEMKQSPFGPAGKVEGTDRNEMMPGGFFLISHSKGKGTMGEIRGLSIFGYDADEKVYTYYSVNNWGEKELAKGTVDGNTWTWNAESEMGGKDVKTRFTVNEVSPTSYTMKFDAMSDSTSWTTLMEGKATKVK
jgi:hypothetical protein